jgi:hypothetical protein
MLRSEESQWGGEEYWAEGDQLLESVGGGELPSSGEESYGENDQTR